MNVSARIAAMQESPIRKLVPIAENAKKQGKKVYHLNIGQPDIETPKEFFDAVKGFSSNVLEYSFSQGMPKLIDAMRGYYKKYDMDFKENHILITNGGSEALMFALVATCDMGDEILVPEPFYTNYNGFSLPVGVVIKPITTYAEQGFALPSKDEMAKLVTPRTRAILLSNPGNPTGAVYDRKQVQAVADLAKEHDLYIIADEVYREFTYDGLEYTSFGSLPEVEDRVIIIDSISKRFSACGARIGSIACKNDFLMKNVLKLCQSRLCVPTLEMLGAIELYNKTDAGYFKAVNQEYTKRRDIVYNALKSMPGVICEKPRGAFYVIAKLPVQDAEEFVVWLLKEFDVNGETVMFAPAQGFYATKGMGVDEVRMAYVLKGEALEKAMNILRKALEVYPKRK